MKKASSQLYFAKRIRQWYSLYVVQLVIGVALTVYLTRELSSYGSVGFWISILTGVFFVCFLIVGPPAIKNRTRERAEKLQRKAGQKWLGGKAQELTSEIRALVIRQRRKQRRSGEIEVIVIPKDDNTPPEYGAALVDVADSISGKDALVVTQELWELLDDQERQGAIAHEVAHEDRLENHLNYLTDCLLTALFIAVLLVTLYGLITTALWPTVLSVVLPFTVVRIAAAFVNAHLSQLVEYITDLRAVEATGNCEAYVRMLEKIDSAEAVISPEIAEVRDYFITRILSPHPTTKERVSALESVEGF